MARCGRSWFGFDRGSEWLERRALIGSLRRPAENVAILKRALDVNTTVQAFDGGSCRYSVATA